MIEKDTLVTTIQLQGIHSAAAAETLSTRFTSTVLGQPARVAVTAAAAAIPPITVLHLEATEDVDPVTWTISDYVVSLPHGITLFGMTAAALAIGGAALAHGVRPVAGTRAVRTLLTVWSVAAVIAAVFPTNLRGTEENMSSTIHLVAGGVVFAVLPIAGYLLPAVSVGCRAGVWPAPSWSPPRRSAACSAPRSSSTGCPPPSACQS